MKQSVIKKVERKLITKVYYRKKYNKNRNCIDKKCYFQP